VQTKSKELGEWIEDLQRARQLAMESQELELGRQFKSGKSVDIDVDDTVWVMFPNVGKGKSRKLAFQMHGPYVVKRWLHGAKRTAVLGHEAEPNDEIIAHVDRMVRKRDVPERLKEQWKPVKLKLAVVDNARKQKGAAKERAKAAEEMLKDVDEDVAEELRRELDDVELDLEKIVAKAYAIEKKREGWQYRVRFVGYGAKDDEWYWEENLRETAPEELEEFNRKWAVGDDNEQLDEQEADPTRKKKGAEKPGRKKKGGKKRGRR
jgi:hypothetical protein